MIKIDVKVRDAGNGNDLLTWTAADPGTVGVYRLKVDGEFISSSFDAAKSSWKVKRTQKQEYEVWAYGPQVGLGIYPAVVDPPPPPPPPTSGVAAPGSTGKPIIKVGYTQGIGLSIQQNGATFEDYDFPDGSGDSTVLVGSGNNFKSGVTMRRFRIRKAAIGNAVSWGKHGAYLDCFNSVLEDFDVEGSQYAANGLSIRMGGLVIRRAKISGAHFVLGVFDSDTGQSNGTVLVEDLVGVFKNDTAIWCDAQADFKQTFDLKMTFRNCEFTGPGAVLKASRVRNGTFRFENCKLNGRPMVKNDCPNVPNVTIV